MKNPFPIPLLRDKTSTLGIIFDGSGTTKELLLLSVCIGGTLKSSAERDRRGLLGCCVELLGDKGWLVLRLVDRTGDTPLRAKMYQFNVKQHTLMMANEATKSSCEGATAAADSQHGYLVIAGF